MNNRCSKDDNIFVNNSNKIEPFESPAVSKDSKNAREWFMWLASGMAVVLLQQVMLSSSRKCLPSTGLVQCLLFAPCLIVNGTTTMWSKWIGYSSRLYLQVFLVVASLTLITSALLESEEAPEEWFCWRNIRAMVGLVSAALSTSIGYFNYNSLQSFYPRECVSAYYSGIGVGNMIGALWVAAYQRWLKFDAENNTGYLNDGQMFLFLIPLPLISLWAFFQLDSNDWKHGGDIEEEQIERKNSAGSIQSELGLGNLSVFARFGRMMSLLWCELFYYSVPLFLNYFVYCVLNAGFLAPTYNSDKSFWPVFQLVLRFGGMIGMLFAKRMSDAIQSPWPLPGFNTFMMVLFAIVAFGGNRTEFFVESGGVGRMVVYGAGLVIGCAYGGTTSGVMTCIKTGVQDGPLQEFALGNSGFAVMVGSLLGSLTSIPLEYWVSSVRSA